MMNAQAGCIIFLVTHEVLLTLLVTFDAIVSHEICLLLSSRMNKFSVQIMVCENDAMSKNMHYTV